MGPYRLSILIVDSAPMRYLLYYPLREDGRAVTMPGRAFAASATATERGLLAYDPVTVPV